MKKKVFGQGETHRTCGFEMMSYRDFVLKLGTPKVLIIDNGKAYKRGVHVS